MRAVRIRRATVVVVSLGVALGGCQLTPTFDTGYEVEPWASPETPVTGKLAVASFTESRDDRYYSSAGRLFMTYLPVIPYVSMPFERLDESIQIQSDEIEMHGPGSGATTSSVAPPFETYYYPNSFAEAIAEDLAAAKLFEEVSYIGDQGSDAHRFLLRGNLNASPYRQTTTSFGLGMAGVLLWLVPVPMSKVTGAVDLELELVDQASDSIIWRKQIDESLSRYLTFYTSSAMTYGRHGAFSLNVVPPPRDSKVDRRSLFSWHFEVLRRAMLDAREEIAAAVKNSQ